MMINQVAGTDNLYLSESGEILLQTVDETGETVFIAIGHTVLEAIVALEALEIAVAMAEIRTDH